jgi:RNA polymerase sigma-70 factor (ECF subfamily)
MAEDEQLNFENLVDTHYRALYRFGYSLSKNEHDASDLVQETFAIFAEKGDSIRDPSKAKPWLFTTLHRQFLKQTRKNQRMRPQDPSTLANHAPSTDPTSARALDSASALDALLQVAEIYRAPLSLFYLRHFTYREIGEVLEIPIGTVMSRLARGKVELKEILLHPPNSSDR